MPFMRMTDLVKPSGALLALVSSMVNGTFAADARGRSDAHSERKRVHFMLMSLSMLYSG